MRTYRPGASVNDDYAYSCDSCGKEGAACLIWKDLSGGRDHFSLCLKCVGKLYEKHVLKHDKSDEKIIVKRAVIPEQLRDFVFDRDDNKCVKCGSHENLAIDHIIPFSRGGKTIKKNLQTLCRSCNSSKGNRI